MTPSKEQIIEWARAVGWEVHPRKEQVRVGADALAGLDSTPKVERFAAIVDATAYAKGQEDMRERCAKLCESMEYEFKAGHECAAAIRAMPIQKGGGT